MEPWLSWTVAGLVGASAWFYYSGKSPRQLLSFPAPYGGAAGSSPVKSQERQSGRRKIRNAQPSQSLQSMNSEPLETSSSKPLATGKKRKAESTHGKSHTAVPSPHEPYEIINGEDIDDEYGEREWASQLDARKKGVSLAVPRKAIQTIKKPKARTMSPRASVSETSPSRELPPDDATASHSQIRGPGDVSDMLPTSTSGPLSIRITGVGNTRKQNALHATPTKETKKQRQNRRKAEEQKTQREQDERVRQVHLEQQRKAAREARGEPMKNGMTAPSSASNSWFSHAPTGGIKGNAAAINKPIDAETATQLLDTVDHDATSTTSSNEVYTNATTPATAASTSDQDLRSEKVQLEQLSEQSSWNEVPSKKKKTKGRTLVPKLLPESSMPPISSQKTPLTSDSPVKATSSSSGFQPSRHTNGSVILQHTNHPEDSDWAA